MVEIIQSRRKNFKPISEESLQALQGALVGVHWNAHEKCWSVLAFKSRRTEGIVIGHISSLVLNDVSFKVSLSKKRNAQSKGSKDRHTFIVGIVSTQEAHTQATDEKFIYQSQDNTEPFKDAQGGSLVGSSAFFSTDGKVYKF